MSIRAWSVGVDPSQVVQKADRHTTVLINQSAYDIYLTDAPTKSPVDLPLEPGFGITVYPGQEIWAWSTAQSATLTVAAGVGPIFAAGV